MSTTFPWTFPTEFTEGSPPLNAIYTATEAQRRAEERVRRKPPLVRMWDAEWACQFVIGIERKGHFEWISNDTGPGRLELPFDCDAAQWVYDETARVNAGHGRTVGITVDHCGARWSGILDKFAVEQREDGDVALVVDFVHDYEHLKWIHAWSNPVLPSAFQFPRAFVLAGPVTWVLRLALWMNLWREHNPFLTWPDDPMDLENWLTMGLDQSDWHMVVKPLSFIQAAASGVVWDIFNSRFDNFHDAAHFACEDAEISITCTRYLEGDDPPWEGADLRYGTLVVDFVDKSGIMVGTSHGGSIFDGLIRTVVEFADDFIDSTLEVIEDAETPDGYFTIGSRYTDPEKPYAVFFEGETSAIQTASFVHSPSKGVQILVGGHSAPGVNEAISATVQAIGDILGGLVLIGSLGGSIDALIKPIYEDVILAWSNTTSNQRSQHTGWDRLFEYYQESGGNQAWTITSLLVIRAGMWATKSMTSWRVDVVDGAPFTVGGPGVGHFFLDDRVGLVLEGSDKIHMDRCRKIELDWSDEQPWAEWTINIGDPRVFQDPAQRALGKIERVIASLRNLGVY